MGTTASGKSDLAEEVASTIGARLISADAFQIYRGFDIGTNKPPDRSRYALIDIKDPNEWFSVGEWIELVRVELEQASINQQDVLIVGGTGLYIRALFEGWSDLQPPPSLELRHELDERIKKEGLPAVFRLLNKLDHAVAQRIDQYNPARVRRAMEKVLTKTDLMVAHHLPFRKHKFALDLPVDELNNRIEARTNALIESGWPEETGRLISTGVSKDDPAMRAIGYRTCLDLYEGNLSLTHARTLIANATRRYAKRQRTWLRSEPELVRIDALGNGKGPYRTVIEALA